MDVYNEKLNGAVNGDRSKSLELLELIRKEKIRVPDVVVKIGKKLIENGGIPTDVLCTLYEQIFLAALDINDTILAESCLISLKTKFPHSSRVQRLELMLLESNSKFSQAEAFYNDMLEKNSSNMLVMKRLVAIYKAQGKINEAIIKLNEILKNFQSDVGSWIELCELYLLNGNYSKAAFCYEELILINPLNSFYHERLAEIYMTINGIENLRIARKHIAHSLELKETDNARGLMALLLCTSTIASIKVKQEKEEKELNQRLHQFALTKLQGMYNDVASSGVIDIVNNAILSTKEYFQEG